MREKVSKEIRQYIEADIIPMYDSFDSGHRRDHVQMVIDGCMEMSCKYDVDINMLYVAAAYHDAGLSAGRATHHLESGRIIRNDKTLTRWFSAQQIETMAQAAEDHRASSKHEPRSVYGKIVAEADRKIEPRQIIRRTIQYGLAHYPELDKEGIWQRTLTHLNEKYAEGGYLKLWIPESPNAARLKDLRDIIRNEPILRTLFEELYSVESEAVKQAQ